MNIKINRIWLVVSLFILEIGIAILSGLIDQSNIVNARTTIIKSKTDMNFSKIKKGNYTSLLGKWKLIGHAYNSYDKEGRIRWHPVTKKDKIDFRLVITKKK